MIPFLFDNLSIKLGPEKSVYRKIYMLEIAAIIFIVLTIPLWLPLVAGIVTSLLSFGFMAVFWLILIGVVIFLLLT